VTVGQRERFDLVHEVLAADHALMAEAVPRYLPEREPRKWLYDLVGTYPSRRGKGFRSSLCLSTARAFGGAARDALPSAAAIELLHNAFLVHDDVEDGSERRRGEPTLHDQFGAALAINAGDALAVIAMTPLRENLDVLGFRLSQLVYDEFQTMMHRTIEGQAIELGWRADNVVDLVADDYLNLILLKTCAYTTIYPMRIGALIGSWGTVDLDEITRFGFYLGAAFQIRDDILNLTGSEEKYGKERLGDLYEGKRTLMMIHLLNTAPDGVRAGVVEFLARERETRDARAVEEILELMEAHGSIAYATDFAAGISGMARDAHERAFGRLRPGRDKDFLAEMVEYMLGREL
jgi:geranylgeranyl diphosphate synthase type II